MLQHGEVGQTHPRYSSLGPKTLNIGGISPPEKRKCEVLNKIGYPSRTDNNKHQMMKGEPLAAGLRTGRGIAVLVGQRAWAVHHHVARTILWVTMGPGRYPCRRETINNPKMS